MARFATPQDRRKLLLEHEAGTSIDDLADTYGCDRRTVLAGLDLAEEERSLQRARDAVYRGRLERHFDALSKAAEDIRDSLQSSYPASGEDVWPGHDYRAARDAKLLESLRLHLPGSSVWRLLRDWEAGCREYASRLLRLSGKVEAMVAERGWEPEAAQALGILVRKVAEGCEVPDALGGYPVLANLPPRQVNSFLSHAQRWRETKQLAESIQSLQSVNRQLLDKLDAVISTVMIPGRCQYCSPHR